MRVKVTLTPLNNKIKYRIRGSKLYCSKMKQEIARTRVYSSEDGCWSSVFGSELDKKKFLNFGVC